METKKGLVVVLTINETPTFSPEAPSLAPAASDVEPQAERLNAAKVKAAPAARTRVDFEKGALELNIRSPDVCGRTGLDNDVRYDVSRITSTMSIGFKLKERFL
jgi:hypothetical protein